MSQKTATLYKPPKKQGYKKKVKLNELARIEILLICLKTMQFKEVKWSKKGSLVFAEWYKLSNNNIQCFWGLIKHVNTNNNGKLSYDIELKMVTLSKVPKPKTFLELVKFIKLLQFMATMLLKNRFGTLV